MSKAIALLALLVLAVANWVAVFTFGFGVEVKSWWWVIGCGIFSQGVVSALVRRIEKEKP